MEGGENRTAPNEVLAAPYHSRDYLEFRAANDLRAPYRLEHEFLAGTKKEVAYDRVEAPLVVFINARSGGRVGPRLAADLSRALGRSQVFDLAQYRPDKVLTQIWANLREQEAAGNPRAAVVRSRLRILVAGGDGTIGWLMKTVKTLDLQPPPPIAIMPLGTGNDLSRSFNWGAEFMWRWLDGYVGMYHTLKRIADAQVQLLDCWRIRIHVPSSRFSMSKTYALTAVSVSAADLAASHPQPRQQQQVHLADGGGPAPEGHAQQPAPSPPPSTAPSDAPAIDAHATNGVASAASRGGGGSGDAADAATASPAVAGSRAESVAHDTASQHGVESTRATVGSVVGSAPSNVSEEEGGGGGGGGGGPAVGARPSPGGALSVEGLFWNYFSVGADAEAAYGFHHLREMHPKLAGNRLANQFWYSWFSCSSGWFCNANPSVASFAAVEVLRPAASGGGWAALEVPRSVRALVLVNLQSYAGGHNIWGDASEGAKRKHGWRVPTPNDELIEVVGFGNGFHAATTIATYSRVTHGMRLAQAAGVRLRLRDAQRPPGSARSAYMQLDGEPWSQRIPCGAQEAAVVVEITHAGVSEVLLNQHDVTQAHGGSAPAGLAPSTRERYLSSPPSATSAPSSTHSGSAVGGPRPPG